MDGGRQAALVVFQGIVHRSSLVVLVDKVLSVDMNTILALHMLIFDAFGLKSERTDCAKRTIPKKSIHWFHKSIGSDICRHLLTNMHNQSVFSPSLL